MDIFEKADQLLMFIYGKDKIGGKSFQYDEIIREYASDPHDSKEMTHINYLIRDVLTDALNYLKTGKLEANQRFKMSPIGFKHIYDLLSIKKESNIIFCAMWFDNEMDPAWANAIKPAIEDSGLEALRIDHKHFTGDINAQMIVDINKSKLVVADLTGNRGNVYFEAGYARGIGTQVVYTCNQTTWNDKHNKPQFDINHDPFILWDGANLEGFKSNLYQRIIKVMNF